MAKSTTERYALPLQNETPQPQPSPRKNLSKWVIAIVLVGALIGYLVGNKDISFTALSEAVSRFRLSAVLAALGFILLQYTFTVLRIWALFPQRKSFRFFNVAHGVIYGQLLNTFAPARAGDVWKAIIFSQSPQSQDRQDEKVTVMTSAGIILADKVADIVALIALIFLSGAFLVPGLNFQFPKLNAWVLASLPLMAFTGAVLWKKTLKNRFTAISNWAGHFKKGLGGLTDYRKIMAAVFIGMGAWAFEAIALQLLCASQGLSMGFDQSIFVLCVLNLAIAVPVSLANLGAFEASVVFALGTLGLQTAPALAVATVHHGIHLTAVVVYSSAIAGLRLLPAVARAN